MKTSLEMRVGTDWMGFARIMHNKHLKVHFNKKTPDNVHFLLTSTHVWETRKEQSKEQIEDDKIPHKDSRHEVGDASLAAHKDAVPHRLDPLSTEDAKHNHKADK